jgi:hypothetical protein
MAIRNPQSAIRNPVSGQTAGESLWVFPASPSRMRLKC